MCLLGVEEIKLIEKEVQNAHISYSHLEYDLIDHICCDVETRMEEGHSFTDALIKVKENIGRGGLKQVQQETLLLIDKNYRIMKKSMKTLGVVALAMMALAALFKIQHWPLAGVMLTLSFFIMNFFFFPVAMYVAYKEMYDKKKAVIFVTGTIAGILFMTGVLFKVQHWPFGGILITLGALLLIVFLIQAAITSKAQKSKSKMMHAVYVLGILSVILYVLGFLFKMQHWPGASILLSVSTIILATVFLPWIAYKNFKEFKAVSVEFIFTVCVLFYFLLFGFLLALNNSKYIIDEFIPAGKIFTTTTSSLEKKNNDFYSTIKSNIGAYEKIEKIKLQSNELDSFIEGIKIKLITIVEGVQEMDALELLENPDMINQKGAHVFELMFKKEHGSLAISLKQKVEDFMNSISAILGEENGMERQLIQNVLNTKPKGEGSTKLSWEHRLFGDAFLLASLNNLSAIQCKLRLVENEAIKSVHKLSQISTEKSK